MTKRIIICPGCDEEKPHRAKGLCQRCYSKNRYEENKEEMLANAKARYTANPYKTKHKTKTYPIIETDGARFDVKVVYNMGTGYIGITVSRHGVDYVKVRADRCLKNNPEKYKATKDRWRKANPGKHIASSTRSRKKNPDNKKKTDARYYATHKYQVKERTEKWRAENPEKVREMRHERRTYLCAYSDCIKLNASFAGCDFHHLTPDTGVHIPASLHRSVWHNMKTGEGVGRMNALAMDWLNGVRRESPQTTLEAFI